MVMKKKLKRKLTNILYASNYRIMIYNCETIYYLQFLPSYTNFMNCLYNYKFECDSKGFSFNFTKNDDLHYLYKYITPLNVAGYGEPRKVDLTQFAAIGF